MALVAALGGGAWAAAEIGSGDIKKNAVRSKHIKKGQVKTADIGNAAVKAGKLAGNSVGEAKLRDDAVTGAKIADGAVDTAQLANGAVTPAKSSGAFGSGILGGEVVVPGVGGGLASLGSGSALGPDDGGGEFDLIVPAAADARNLTARAESAIPGDRTAEVRLVKRGTGDVLTCTIPAGGTTCSADGPGVALAAGDRLGIDVFVTATAGSPAFVTFSVEAGYRLTPTG